MTAKKSILFEEDLAVRADYVSCIEGCNFYEAGRMIQCSHCGRWFHLQCVHLEKEIRTDWYHSKECEKAGKSIIVPFGKEYNNWTKDQLKVRLIQYDLTVSGTKKAIIDRLEDREASGLGMWGVGKMEPFNFTFHGAKGQYNYLVLLGILHLNILVCCGVMMCGPC